MDAKDRTWGRGICKTIYGGSCVFSSVVPSTRHCLFHFLTLVECNHVRYGSSSMQGTHLEIYPYVGMSLLGLPIHLMTLGLRVVQRTDTE